MNIDELLEKYWEGETDLAEELKLKEYFNGPNISIKHEAFSHLFTFYKAEKIEKPTRDFGTFIDQLGSVEAKPPSSKVPFVRKWAAAAAVLLMVGFSIAFFGNNDSEKVQYAMVNGQVIEDPDEALRITMDALGFLSNKLEDGTSPMNKNFKIANRNNIIKK